MNEYKCVGFLTGREWGVYQEADTPLEALSKTFPPPLNCHWEDRKESAIKGVYAYITPTGTKNEKYYFYLHDNG